MTFFTKINLFSIYFHYKLLLYIPKIDLNVIIVFKLNFGDFPNFTRHHNIPEKFEKSVIPIISDCLTGRILFSASFYVNTLNFPEFE